MAKLEQIRTISRERLLAKRGALTAEQMQAIDRALRRSLGLDDPIA